MITAIVAISLLALFFGLLLGYSNIRFHVEEDPIAEKVNDLLPQSQCGQCGYPGCLPYAEAVAKGEAPINMCPPGGESTMLSLSELLGVEPMPMDAVAEEDAGRKVAVIDEQVCIGCTVCIKACPVDAILGATKQMHTVISEECTGCEKCMEPCPVDCITMEKERPDVGSWVWPFPADGQPCEVAEVKVAQDDATEIEERKAA